ncbi:MAG: nuclear transport factor 2 family protein [Cellvibrionales bacterium]|nr:nuclear transport factor 2 family protein [Cellvibrionales bacterium]
MVELKNVISKKEAKDLANHHCSVWNTHIINSIMDLYDDNVELFSPLAERITGKFNIKGKDNVQQYFLTGINKYPDLQFKLINVFVCLDTIVLHMEGAGKARLAEVLFLNDERRIKKVMAHYECE